MVEIIGLLVLLIVSVAILFIAVAYPRVHSKWWLARRMYQHVDDHIGAKAFEREYAVTMRNVWGKYKDEKGVTRERSLAVWLWPHPELSGTMARPHWWRRAQYVQLGFAEKPWPMPYFKKDITHVTIMWTSETRVNRSQDWFVILEQQVAQALSLPYTEDLFVHNRTDFPYSNGLEDHRPERDQVTLELAERVELPRQISAADALNGRLDTNGPVKVE